MVHPVYFKGLHLQEEFVNYISRTSLKIQITFIKWTHFWFPLRDSVDLIIVGKYLVYKDYITIYFSLSFFILFFFFF